LQFLLRHLSTVIHHLPSAVYVCEAPGGVIRLYNARAAELWGREPKLGDTDERFCGAFRLFRPDGRFLPHAETPMAEALRDGGEYDEEVTIERADGSRVQVRVNIAPLRDPSGAIVGAINIFHDITERQRREEALRREEARYRAIVEDNPDLISRFLTDGTLTFVNDAYCRYFGLRRADVVGTRYTPLVHPDDRTRGQAAVATLDSSNRVTVIENRVTRGDGAVRWTEWTNQASTTTAAGSWSSSPPAATSPSASARRTTRPASRPSWRAPTTPSSASRSTGPWSRGTAPPSGCSGTRKPRSWASRSRRSSRPSGGTSSGRSSRAGSAARPSTTSRPSAPPGTAAGWRSR
ncbi:MAG: PAS domain S-box protein, partial [Candidatus Rokubacteria bacterium]|nr:PAS domain S-box protein [Candidatus Rokubacteria bacterium]